MVSKRLNFGMLIETEIEVAGAVRLEPNQLQIKLDSFTTSETNRHLFRQKVRQRISVIPENWHFNSRFVLKTTKTPVFVFITEIL